MSCKKSTIKNTLNVESSISYRRCSDNMFIDQTTLKPGQQINVWYYANSLQTPNQGQLITNTTDFPPVESQLTLECYVNSGSVIITYILKNQTILNTMLDTIATVTL